MSELQPDQVWWTAAEIAGAKLPDFPTTKRRVNDHIERHSWKVHAEFARPRKARGGGWEFHWKLFPQAAQKKLLSTAAPAPESARMGRTEAWAWLERLPEHTKDQARERLLIIQLVEAMEGAGQTRDLAVKQIASQHGVGARTVWSWMGAIEGIAAEDRLPYLAPRHHAAARKNRLADCDEQFTDVLKADYLRLERPTFKSAYRRAVRIAKENGWAYLGEKTAKRHLDRDVSQLTQLYCRKGIDAVKRAYPAQVRDRTALHAMEAVNADYHRFDVFVRWPTGEIVRPQMCAFQDIYSGRFLSWRVDQTPNKVGVSLALGDMVERFGIPEHVLLDNGREFANKFLTGGVPTRFRFKVKEDDIPGILPTLGCTVHWATPYSGQSKPIERAFRDLCDDIAKDPRFAGAYTGNRPDAKPENYGSHAVPLERFLEVLAEGMEEHNARGARRGQTTDGRSILETFEASYATAPIRKATEEQRRLWLMGAEGLRADRHTGQVKFYGNDFWADWMHEIAGEKVVARFDPADFRQGLHIYGINGGYLGHAEMQSAKGFFDLDEARLHASARRKFMSAEKAAAEAARNLRVAELGDYLDASGRGKEPTPAPEAQVVRPAIFDRKPKHKVQPAQSPEAVAAHATFVTNFVERKAKQAPNRDDAETRYARAKEIEARLTAKEPVTRDDERWFIGYRNEPEFKARERLASRFGKNTAG